MNGNGPNDSDTPLAQAATAMREKRALEEELDRLQAAAREAAVRAQERQEAAVEDVLEVLASTSARAQALEDALVECTDAIHGLVGLPLSGSREQVAGWRQRLDRVWSARARAVEVLPKRQA